MTRSGPTRSLVLAAVIVCLNTAGLRADEPLSADGSGKLQIAPLPEFGQLTPAPWPKFEPMASQGKEKKSHTLVDPFAFAPPSVAAIPADSDRSQDSTTGDDQDSWAASDVRDYRFDTAAHFPQLAFGPNGQTLERRGVIIYEGMQFAIKPDGSYRVRFTMSTPAMPVTVRLQLVVEDSLGAEYTVTLPSIIVPEKDEPVSSSRRPQVNPVYQRTWIVNHEGFLPTLRHGPVTIARVRRHGVARFGFGVDVP